MTDQGCQRCNWPLVSDPNKGCINGMCSCVCAGYPKCACGEWDKANPEAPMAVNRNSILAAPQAPASNPNAFRHEGARNALPVAPSTKLPGDRTHEQLREGGPIAAPTGEIMVLIHQAPDSAAQIIYVGTDKGKAFDKLMEYGKKYVCQLSDLQVGKQTD